MLTKLMKRMASNGNKKGFTLVELMVVVVIIGILTAVAIPVYNNVTDNAKKKAHNANVRILKSAAQMYLMEKGTENIPVGDISTSIDQYLDGFVSDLIPPNRTSENQQYRVSIVTDTGSDGVVAYDVVVTVN